MVGRGWARLDPKLGPLGEKPGPGSVAILSMESAAIPTGADQGGRGRQVRRRLRAQVKLDLSPLEAMLCYKNLWMLEWMFERALLLSLGEIRHN